MARRVSSLVRRMLQSFRPSKVRAVFFDLDGTLFDRDAFLRDLFGEQYKSFQTELGAVSEDQFTRRLIELEGHGHGRKSQIYRRAAEEWGLSQDLANRLLGHFRSVYTSDFKLDSGGPRLHLSEDTRTTLQALRAHRKKIGVITNGTTVRQQQKLKLLGISTLFDTVLISESEGVGKPEPEIFRRALRRCAVQAHEAVFVGDHPEVDVAAAKRAGLIPIWKFVPYWRLKTENVLTVQELSEILPLCLESQTGLTRDQS